MDSYREKYRPELRGVEVLSPACNPIYQKYLSAKLNDSPGLPQQQINFPEHSTDLPGKVKCGTIPFVTTDSTGIPNFVENWDLNFPSYHDIVNRDKSFYTHGGIRQYQAEKQLELKDRQCSFCPK